jgi:hypothetical protein
MRARTTLFALAALLSARPATAQLTVFTSKAAFDAAVGPTTTETFTNTSHFPLATGVLNSSTVGAGLVAGDIRPGATYSSLPVGPGSFFNIDAGGVYSGGFLDGIGQNPNAPLVVTFDTPASAFGFVTNDFMGSSFSLTANLVGGGSYANVFSGLGGALQFFGFRSASAGITSVSILGDNASGFRFALDDFQFNAAPTTPTTTTPEPLSVTLVAGGLLGIGGVARRRRAR